MRYDTDVEKARKTIKKIGAERAEDPELAASTLQPLKMQGVDSFGEFAIILKVTTSVEYGVARAAPRQGWGGVGDLSQDEIGTAVAQHHGGSVGISGVDVGSRRHVAHPQP